MELASIALGSNLGDRLAALRRAVRDLESRPDAVVAACSPVYEAEAHTLRAGKEQPAFLNAVITLRTRLSAAELLEVCQALERRAGRKPSARWAPRELDVDILTWGAATHRAPHLVLPHPHLGERRFVLQPWSDIAPQLFVPAPFEAAVAELLARCTDAHELTRTGAELR